MELLVFYGPPFPLPDQDGNNLSCPETPESSISSLSSSLSNESESSHEAVQAVRSGGRAGWLPRCDQWALSLCEPH